jgi:hypothetical protein
MFLAYLAYRVSVRDERREVQIIIKEKSENTLQKFQELGMAINNLSIYGVAVIEKINEIYGDYNAEKDIQLNCPEDNSQNCIISSDEKIYESLKDVLLDFWNEARKSLADPLYKIQTDPIGRKILSGAGDILIGDHKYKPSVLINTFIQNGGNKILKLSNNEVMHIFNIVDTLSPIVHNYIYEQMDYYYLISRHRVNHSSIILLSSLFTFIEKSREVSDSDYKKSIDCDNKNEEYVYNEPFDWIDLKNECENSEYNFCSIDCLYPGPMIMYWLVNCFVDNIKFKKYVLENFESITSQQVFNKIFITCDPSSIIFQEIIDQTESIKQVLQLETKLIDNKKVLYSGNENILKLFLRIEKDLRAQTYSKDALRGL